MTPISTTSAVTPFTARTRVLPRGETRDSRAYLLQVRGQQHKRQSQAQFRRSAGLLCQKTGPQMQRDRRSEEHCLRPHRYQILRYGRLREISRWPDDRLHPYGRRARRFPREAAADVKALCGVSHRCAKEVAPLTRSYKGILSRQHTTIPPFNSYP